jgi:hypothetical protein
MIVVQRARGHGVALGFWAYCKIGARLAILTMLLGSWWLL